MSARASRKTQGSVLPLTEAQLLQMPAADYMSEAQLGFFRQRLLVLRQELIDNIGATSAHLQDIATAPDPMDRATQEEEQAIELRTRDRERKLMKKITRALAMIDEETYGWCEETGDPIGLQRLLARPTATLSLEAQERKEKLERVYGR